MACRVAQSEEGAGPCRCQGSSSWACSRQGAACSWCSANTCHSVMHTTSCRSRALRVCQSTILGRTLPRQPLQGPQVQQVGLHKLVQRPSSSSSRRQLSMHLKVLSSRARLREVSPSQGNSRCPACRAPQVQQLGGGKLASICCNSSLRSGHIEVSSSSKCRLCLQVTQAAQCWRALSLLSLGHRTVRACATVTQAALGKAQHSRLRLCCKVSRLHQAQQGPPGLSTLPSSSSLVRICPADRSHPQ